MKSVLIIFIGIISSTLIDTGYATHHPHKGHDAKHYHRHELPKRVIVRLSDRYHHFDLIHTRRIRHRGHLSFELILQHGNRFLEVSISERGRIYGEVSYRRFPLIDHYCDDLCSFQYGHYDDHGFASYDPYYGCEVHNNLISMNYRNYRYQPYYGLSWMHYHPEYRVYKRFRYNRASSRALYRQPATRPWWRCPARRGWSAPCVRWPAGGAG